MLSDLSAARLAEELERTLGPGPNGPTMSVDQGIHTVNWGHPEWVRFECDRLHTSRREGETTGELVIWLTSEGDHRLIHRTRLNLLSTVAQEKLAKYLSGRTSEQKINWVEIISRTCSLITESYRAGEPPMLLRDVEDQTSGSFLPPLLADDGATVMFGDGGTGKSLLALAAATSIHTGRLLIPGMEPTTIRRVLFLDWEWSPHIHKQRLRALWHDDELPDLPYLQCQLPLKDEFDRIRYAIHSLGTDFLVIDSVGYAAGGEPESAEIAVGFFGSLRQLGLPSLCTAHITNAAAKTSADRPFGSAFFHNGARRTWYVRRSDGSGQNLVLGLFNRKSNEGALAHPVGITVEFGDEIHLRRSEVGDEADLSSQLPVRWRIVELLKRKPMLTHQIADELEIPLNTVGVTLKRGLGKQFTRRNRPDGIEEWALLVV